MGLYSPEHTERMNQTKQSQVFWILRALRESGNHQQNRMVKQFASQLPLRHKK